MKSAKSTVLIIAACLLPVFASAVEHGKSIVWRAAPLPAKHFVISEFGYSFRLSQSSAPRYGGNRQFHLQWEYGLMKNIKPGWAVGVTGYYSADDDGSRLAAKLRGRVWLNRHTSVDLGAGPIIQTFSSLIDSAPGLVAGISLNRSDLISVGVTLEMIPWEEPLFTGGYTGPPTYRKGTETTMYIGAKFGSYPGAILGVAVPLAILISEMTRYEP
ncbi:hypothetical protein C3F09_07295 [candidate division GN15 bacterium]|uniref:MipA/OmpV family protein n=1 Tax=candidate division GN15 bacterium TaxID=2072418 RepID=A0A855X6N1_9BACT|nr:MAG: hypothetical protein C3F09_07295 [candidate division GN15 bacterium]